MFERKAMFAVVETGGKQYQVEVGDVIKVEKLEIGVGTKFNFDRVLLVNDKIGTPTLENAKVEAEVLEHKKADKDIIFKKKRRHNYRRKIGHRQNITVLRIKNIEA
jgi:large subunit ribosomal protein L21